MANWWKSGNKEVADEQAEKERRRNAAQEFRLSVGDTRNVLFLESITPETGGCWYHELELDEDWQTRTKCTCLKGTDDGPCTICQSPIRKWVDPAKKKEVDFSRTHINAVTIVDLTPWQKEGDPTAPLHVAMKRLLLLKSKSYQLLMGKNERQVKAGYPEGLKGWIYSVVRQPDPNPKTGQEQSPAVGNDWEPLAKMGPGDKLPLRPDGQPLLTLADGRPHPGFVTHEGKPMDMALFDYGKIFAPKTKVEIEGMFRDHKVSDGLVFKPGAAGAGKKSGSSVKY